MELGIQPVVWVSFSSEGCAKALSIFTHLIKILYSDLFLINCLTLTPYNSVKKEKKKTN